MISSSGICDIWEELANLVEGLLCNNEFLRSLPSDLVLPVPNSAVFLNDPLRLRPLLIRCESAIALYTPRSSESSIALLSPWDDGTWFSSKGVRRKLNLDSILPLKLRLCLPASDAGGLMSSCCASWWLLLALSVLVGTPFSMLRAL